jgi:hypothetical protein
MDQAAAAYDSPSPIISSADSLLLDMNPRNPINSASMKDHPEQMSSSAQQEYSTEADVDDDHHHHHHQLADDPGAAADHGENEHDHHHHGDHEDQDRRYRDPLLQVIHDDQQPAAIGSIWSNNTDRKDADCADGIPRDYSRNYSDADDQDRSTRSSSRSVNLPPGFRFHPSDEELVTYYLANKILDPLRFTSPAITDVDLNKSEPWELPGN